MLRFTWVAVVVATGCSFRGPSLGADAARPVDARLVDGTPPVDALDGPPCTSWATTFDTCGLPPAPGTDLVLGSNTFNTDTGTFATPLPTPGTFLVASVHQTNGLDATVLVVKSLAQGGMLRVLGSRPLIIAADTTIAIGGTIDASSHRGDGTAGAGSDGTPCNPAMLGSNITDGGGGGGGGLQTSGAAGGTGDHGATGGAGAPAVGVVPMVLRGGCAGAHGGMASGGLPGLGGGAVELAARGSIAATGTVLAGGMGGQGGGHGAMKGGGGGGGAGGMIVVEAPSVMLLATSVLAAHGGGGGGGADTGVATSGADGGAMAAAGGMPSGQGGAGGTGAFATTTATTGAAGTGGGGGGGGGGTGYIRIVAPQLQSMGRVSPPAT